MTSQLEERRTIKTERQGLYPPPFLGPAPHTDILGYQVSLTVKNMTLIVLNTFCLDRILFLVKTFLHISIYLYIYLFYSHIVQTLKVCLGWVGEMKEC